MRIVIALTLLVASLPACEKTKAEPPAPEDTDPSLARITVNQAGVSLGAEQLGPHSPGDKPTLVKPLMDKLGARRGTWEAAHPNQTWEGRAEIEVGPGVSCSAALDVLQTAILASFGSFTLRSGAVRLEVPAHSPLMQPTPPSTRRAFLTFRGDGSVDLRPTACLAPFDTVPVDAVPAAMKDWLGETAESVGQTFIACEEATPAEKVIAALAELRKSAKLMTIGRAPACGKARMAGLEGQRLTLGMTDPLDDLYPGWELMAPEREKGPPKGSRPPVISVGKITVGDAAAPAELTSAVQARESDLAFCYHYRLDRKPGLRGTVVAQLDIGRKGGLMKVRQGDKTDLPDPVVRCVLGALTTVTFPPISGGKAAVVTVPITFSPGR